MRSIDDMIRRAIRARKVRDSFRFRSMWTIEKHMPGQPRPYETLVFPHNLALKEGLNLLFSLLCGGAGTALNNANANIGVGDSGDAADSDQEGLQAAVNKLYKGMEAGYPISGADEKAIFRSKFLGAEANFAWKEITVANGDDDADVNLNRKVQAMGTKASPTEWYATLEITGA